MKINFPKGPFRLDRGESKMIVFEKEGKLFKIPEKYYTYDIPYMGLGQLGSFFGAKEINPTLSDLTEMETNNVPYITSVFSMNLVDAMAFFQHRPQGVLVCQGTLSVNHANLPTCNEQQFVFKGGDGHLYYTIGTKELPRVKLFMNPSAPPNPFPLHLLNTSPEFNHLYTPYCYELVDELLH